MPHTSFDASQYAGALARIQAHCSYGWPAYHRPSSRSISPMEVTLRVDLGPVLPDLVHHRQQRQQHDHDGRRREVVLDLRVALPEPPAERGRQPRPEGTADEVARDEHAVAHPAHTGEHRREG